jgi:dCTP deaminase
MSLLRDVDLVQELSVIPPFIEDLPNLPKELLYSSSSPIQPSSIDLRVGEILVPGILKTDPASTVATGEFILGAGNTAIVKTAETLNLPKNMAAIGFPPSHISIKGLLMTNPGHVDPGYKGKLHLTVINMSRTSITLRRGDPILTVVFYKLDGDCKVGYEERKIGHISTAISASLLSPDFLDITKRAQAIADKAVTRSAVWAGVIAALVTIISVAIPYFFDTRKDIAVLEESSKRLQEDNHSLQETLKSVQLSVVTLEQKQAFLDKSEKK